MLKYVVHIGVFQNSNFDGRVEVGIVVVVVVQSLSRARLFCDSSSSKAKTNFIQTFKSVIRQGARHWLQKKMNEVKVKD